MGGNILCVYMCWDSLGAYVFPTKTLDAQCLLKINNSLSQCREINEEKVECFSLHNKARCMVFIYK